MIYFFLFYICFSLSWVFIHVFISSYYLAICYKQERPTHMARLAHMEFLVRSQSLWIKVIVTFWISLVSLLKMSFSMIIGILLPLWSLLHIEAIKIVKQKRIDNFIIGPQHIKELKGNATFRVWFVGSYSIII